MAKLTEEMVIARSRQSDLSAIKKLNCWGAELGDVSVLRKMPNVEVLALSLNKIRSLGDFAGCVALRELYVRKNEIASLQELRHLRRLPRLASLWLDENPCTQDPRYRMTVLRNLPNLEKLDNVAVHPDEVQEAMRVGNYIPDSDDEGYPAQDNYSEYRETRSVESSPEREPETYYRREGSDSSEAGGDGHTGHPPQPPCPMSPPSRAERTDDQMTRSHYVTRRSPDSMPLRHSFSAHSVKEYGYGGAESRPPTQHRPHDADRGRCARVTSPPHHYECCERTDRFIGDRCEPSASSGPEFPSAVMAERRGFTRRPVARNSNLLSAVLCLVKELDYPSLEVAEMAVRCRMDELASGQ